MKFKCPKCGKIIKRDLRRNIIKEFYAKRGYKTYCNQFQGYIYAKEV